MMKYEDAKKAIYAYGTIPSGYFGATERVGYAFDPASGHTVTVIDSGCNFSGSGLPLAVDQAESLWLLLNHPSSRATHIKVIN
jgi:hypothetical protein